MTLMNCEFCGSQMEATADGVVEHTKICLRPYMVNHRCSIAPADTGEDDERILKLMKDERVALNRSIESLAEKIANKKVDALNKTLGLPMFGPRNSVPESYGLFSIFPVSDKQLSIVTSQHQDAMLFPDHHSAVAINKAIRTLVKLRRMPGAEINIHRKHQWVIEFLRRGTAVGGHRLIIGNYEALSRKTGLSGAFATESDALNAIKTVGEQDIIEMYKVFGGIK